MTTVIITCFINKIKVDTKFYKIRTKLTKYLKNLSYIFFNVIRQRMRRKKVYIKINFYYPKAGSI